MTTTLVVDCINKTNHPDPTEKIDNIGGVANGKRWKHSEAQAIAMIEDKSTRFVVRYLSKVVEIIVAESSHGRKYLRTEPDAYSENNLLNLPECPA